MMIIRLISLILLLSCVGTMKELVVESNSNVTTSPLNKRGYDKEIRKGYLNDLADDFYPYNIYINFIRGKVVLDMSRSMVEMLHGEPNIDLDNVWIYHGTYKSKLLRVKFIKDKVSFFKYY